MSIKEAKGFYPVFTRGGTETRATHYCAGCGHGILHKLVAEALSELGMQDTAVIVNPIGCAVFGYYYWDVGNVGAAHGRAPAVATALNRLLPRSQVISYQGDGDLSAIGMNHTLQAAIRGEHIATFFVNNSVYGMTGGQMAPTTLVGQKTTTSPYGRDPESTGYPIPVCELLDQLQAPVYIERVSLADTKRIMAAKKAVRHALEMQRDGKGYAFVEFLSPCPTNLGLNSIDAAKFCIEQMESVFPLGCLRDRSAEVQPREPKPAPPSLDEYFGVIREAEDPLPAADFPKRQMKFAGFGGQGILTMGINIAEAAHTCGAHSSWLPSYGPEQRGGTASCSVIVSDELIGSPTVEKPDVLVCLNQPSYERFAKDVRPGGVILVDLENPDPGLVPEGVRLIAFPAARFAGEMGAPKAANTAMLAILAATGASGVPEDAIQKAIESALRKKPKLIDINRKIYAAARAWYDSRCR
ncbi:MAG: 2-oxoacid:acceptor oxidoreductase family protein [Kiritimatiellia bacterium]|jgi:2-oxoisovalerate ferredoxin oxidoreductase beta subunit